MTTQKYLPMAPAGYYDTLGGFFPIRQFSNFPLIHGMEQAHSEFPISRTKLCHAYFYSQRNSLWLYLVENTDP